MKNASAERVREAIKTLRKDVDYLGGDYNALEIVVTAAQTSINSCEVVTVEQMMQYFDPDECVGIENYLRMWAVRYSNGIRIISEDKK